MGLLNNVFRWFILDRMRQIEAFNSFPGPIQQKVRGELLSSAKDTEWGRKYGFSTISTYSQFTERIPLQDYNSLKPDIDRMMRGEPNVLWPGVINWYAKSSGTTEDKSKYIPVSKESLQDCHFKAGKDMYAIYYSLHPEANLVDGKSLVLGGSHQVSRFNKDCYYGDLSAVLLQNLPYWAQAKRVPSLSIVLMDNWEQKIEQMARAIVNESVTNILGVPTWTVVLIRKLFEITGKNNLSDIWPGLELYVHGGVSFTPYDDLFKSLIHSPGINYMETFNASEGFFAIQDTAGTRDLLLMLDYGIFYEFIPAEELQNDNPKTIQLEEVELNKNYALVISTNSGLWRYMVGDTVKFTSREPYRLMVTGRTKHFINAFGEEVIVDNAEKAISYASAKMECIVNDYTAAPIYFTGNSNGAHEWLIEFETEPHTLDEFTRHLDESLKSVNSDYEAKRFKDMALGMPIVRPLDKGTFYNWMKSRGKLGGQHKVPRLSNERKFVDEIMEFIKK
jgi:hypothetical protein